MPVLDCGGLSKTTNQTRIKPLECGCSVAKLLGVEIRFNTLDAYDKRYCERFMPTIRRNLKCIVCGQFIYYMCLGSFKFRCLDQFLN